MALLYEEESYKIRGACFAVYNSLGGGIKEKIIENALIKELTNAGLRVSSQTRIDWISYKFWPSETFNQAFYSYNAD